MKEPSQSLRRLRYTVIAFVELLIVDSTLKFRGFQAVYRRVAHCPIPKKPPSKEATRETLDAVDCACAFYFRRVHCLARAAVTTCGVPRPFCKKGWALLL